MKLLDCQVENLHEDDIIRQKKNRSQTKQSSNFIWITIRGEKPLTCDKKEESDKP